MSHHVYHTRGVILGSVSVSEANRFYKILTEDFGLVGASAQAVREGKSKLRYALQDYSFVSLDLVRGKEVWRIVSASELLGAPKNSEALTLFVRMCHLVSRMVHGEGKVDNLFQDVVSAREFLEKERFFPNHMQAFETLAALRVVVSLGYLDPERYEEFLQYGAWSQSVLEAFGKLRGEVIPEINKALAASHL